MCRVRVHQADDLDASKRLYMDPLYFLRVACDHIGFNLI
jgi:hypothetical protein